MSGFCVFGVSRANCKQRAERAVPSSRFLTVDEYAQRVAEIERELFSAEARPRQISPVFDAPQFAEEWIAVALKTEDIKSPKIMVRGVNTDRRGNQKVNKKGIPVISWVPYEPQRSAAA